MKIYIKRDKFIDSIEFYNREDDEDEFDDDDELTEEEEKFFDEVLRKILKMWTR